MISFNSLGNYGRLGNQMFQYAALRGIASNRGYDYCIPGPETFGTADGLVASSDSNLHTTFKLRPCNRGLTSFVAVHETMHNFDSELFNTCADNVDLLGYFQTDKYFKHIESSIREDFEFVDAVVDVCNGYMNQIRRGDIIALHIRRGDYVGLQSYHPLSTLDYYTTALQQLPNVQVLVFSDDIEWCKAQQLFRGDRFMFSTRNSTAVDLCLMSMCDYHIIANSSFSWWGAWLANSKQVFAPNQWFGSALSDKNTADVYCDGWIKI